MFENVLSQEAVIRELRSLIADERMPGSILFEGPPYSGKLTAALETARGLTCTADRAWGCSCRSCREQRVLVHASTKLLGPRNFLDEISASADVLTRVSRPAARYLYVRAVRKLIRRFDSDLWDETDRRYRSVGSAIDQIN